MEVLPVLNEVELSPLKAVSGLYVSSRSVAATPDRLLSNGITHVVRVLQTHELLRKSASADWTSIKIKHITIDDDGDEDILILLNDVYQWIEDALHPPPPQNNRNISIPTAPSNRVLIHCRLGMSRSGAIAVAYLMKRLSLSFSTALALARESRPIITPNPGFERQLRIWEHCCYDIYLPLKPPSPVSVSTPGEDSVDNKLDINSTRTTKAAYNVWKKERDDATQSERETRRAGAMARAAAEFGRRRRLAAQEVVRDRALIESGELKSIEKEGAFEDGIGSGFRTGNEAALKRQGQWDRVEEMEKACNDKLIRGDM